MTTSQTVPDLIEDALVSAKLFEDRIRRARGGLEGQPATAAQKEAQRAAYVALELAAIDVFTLFEARMQHHFKRGPFSRKLKTALLEARKADLANRIHTYYLAINVLKHGTGASYRELLGSSTRSFQVKQVERGTSQDVDAPSSYIDIDVPGFFDGLAQTLLEAHQFLEKR
ncbi:MAG: hypothetical protein ABJO27_16620 [Pseudoruegeria sp.]